MSPVPWRGFERSMLIEADRRRRLGGGELRSYPGPVPVADRRPVALETLVRGLTGGQPAARGAVDRLADAVRTSDRLLIAWSHDAPVGLVTARWARTRSLEGWYLTLAWASAGSAARGLLSTMAASLVDERPGAFVATTTVSPAVHRALRGVSPTRSVFPGGGRTEPEPIVALSRAVLAGLFGSRVAAGLSDGLVRPGWIIGGPPAAASAPRAAPLDRLGADDGLFVLADLDGRLSGERRRPNPERPRTVAVTGTNGKTSVVEYGRQLSRACGRDAVSLGSLGLVSDRGRVRRPRVGRGPGALAGAAHRLWERGTDRLWFEAFSRPLAAGLLEGVDADVAVLTQIDLDHLSVHRSPARYRAAKLRLFERVLVPGGTAVVDPAAAGADEVLEVCRRRRLDVVRVGPGGDVVLRDTAPDGERRAATLVVHGVEHAVVLPTSAPYQWENLIGAVAAAVAVGEPADRVADFVGDLQPPPGRLARVENPVGIDIVVDAAHNGSGLEATLRHLRSETDGRLLTLVASVGSSDRNRWESIGEAAAVLADEVVVADESPHGVDPATIRAGILSGCPGATEIADRAEAVGWILDRAAAGDTVVLAGRADEDFLVTATGRESYPTDAELVQDWLRVNADADGRSRPVSG